MGRSYLAFVLAPELPFVDWLVELDRRVENSLSFFANRPLVLDLTGVAPTRAETAEIIAFIEERHLRLIAVEGVSLDGYPIVWHRFPAKSDGRRVPATGSRKPTRSAPPAPGAGAIHRFSCAALLVNEPVRPQWIIYPHGDVIIVGSVALALKSSPQVPSMSTAARVAPFAGPMAIQTRIFAASLMPR